MKSYSNANRNRANHRHLAVRLFALLCIVVLAVFFTAQVAHQHNEATPDNHCRLCLIAHWAIPAVASLTMIGFFCLSITYTAELSNTVARFWFHALYNRPPPCTSVLA